MDKRTIDQFKGSQREIDLINDRVAIDGKLYFIREKSFNNGIITIKCSIYQFLDDVSAYYTIKMELAGFVTKWHHYLIAMSCINKSDTFITRLKNRIKIIKYFLLN